MALRDDHLRIALRRETIVLPRASGEAMLGRLRQFNSMRDVRETLESIEAPELLRLTAAQKVGLIQLIEQWGSDVDGLNSGLPSGILELRNALLDDLSDAPSD
jgi:hypothetical protein